MSPSSSTNQGLFVARRTSTPIDRDAFIFEGGDVQILIAYKEEILEGLICSQCLVLASPVWKKFIFPPWTSTPPYVPHPDDTITSNSAIISTSNKPPFAKIDCTEDDGVALLILLNIVHLKHRRIPSKLQFSVLLQVAVLCEKYMCVELVQPWLQIWTSNLEIRSKYPLAEQVLYTHWVFGQEQEFEKIAQEMVLEVKINEHRQLLNKYNWLWAEPFPPGIAENIFRIRHELVSRLLAIPNSMVAMYERTNDNICQLGDIRGEDNACDAISWGSLTRGMQLAGLWPIKSDEKVHLSVDEVASAIESIHIYHFHTHPNCGKSNLAEEVARVLRQIESPVMDAQKRHMARQRGEME